MDQYELIRTMHLRYKKSIRQIHRETGHSRKTIRKALEVQEIKYRQTKPRPRPVTGAVEEKVLQWLKKDKEVHRKQRHTAKRIYDRLVVEENFQGSASIVRLMVRRLKEELGLLEVEAMIPLDPEIAREAEVDWGEARVILNGEIKKVELFCVRSRYSGGVFVRAYPCERKELFFDGHQHAFKWFGGVFPVMVYDNLKTAVNKIVGKEREEQASFKKLRAYYGFEARFCNVASGNEKGGVESLVKQAQRNWLTPMPEVRSFAELNECLEKACEGYNQGSVQGRKDQRAICERQIEEQEWLIKQPKTAYSTTVMRKVKVNKYQMIQVDSSRYSVPGKYVGHQLTCYMDVEKVRLYAGEKKVAEHQRSYERGQWVLEPQHYLEALLLKPRAFDAALPIREWRAVWPASYERLLVQQRAKEGYSEGTQQFLNVLMLHVGNRAEEVETAVALAQEQELCHPEAIKQILLQLTRKEEPRVPPISVDQLPAKARFQVGTTKLAAYDQLGSRGVPA